jgi:hypothetical protein
MGVMSCRVAKRCFLLSGGVIIHRDRYHGNNIVCQLRVNNLEDLVKKYGTRWKLLDPRGEYAGSNRVYSL